MCLVQIFFRAFWQAPRVVQVCMCAAPRALFQVRYAGAFGRPPNSSSPSALLLDLATAYVDWPAHAQVGGLHEQGLRHPGLQMANGPFDVVAIFHALDVGAHLSEGWIKKKQRPFLQVDYLLQHE